MQAVPCRVPNGSLVELACRFSSLAGEMPCRLEPERLTHKSRGTRTFVLMLVLVFLIHSSSFFAQAHAQAHAQAQGAGQDPQEINCEAMIREQRSMETQPFFFAVAELEQLEAGQTYRLNIVVRNPADLAIRFSEFSASCGCAKVKIHGEQIPPFGESLVQMDLKVPNPTNGGQEFLRGQVGVKFTSPDPTDVGFSLTVNYSVGNSFAFRVDRVDVEIPGKEQVIVKKVPILLTPPMTFDQLELKTTENLRDFSAKLVNGDSDLPLPYAELKIAKAAVPRGGIVGELILMRKGAEHVTGIMVRVQHQMAVVLRPESIRLVRDNDSKPFVATAVLRVGNEDNGLPSDDKRSAGGDQNQSTEEKQKPIAAPIVELMIGGNAAKVDVKKIGNGRVYRVTVHYEGPLDASDKDNLKVLWRVNYAGQEYVIESHAFVPAKHP